MSDPDLDPRVDSEMTIRSGIERVSLFLRKYSAVFLLLFGALMLYVFVSVGFWSIIGPISGIVIGGAIGVIGILLNRFYKVPGRSGRDGFDKLDFRLSITLPSLYAVSIILLFRFHTYHRPTLLYVLFGGYAGIIAYQISKNAPAYKIVPQILVLSFFTYWSSQFLFPAGMAGPDTMQGYIPGIEQIFSTGRIPAHQVIYAGHLGYAAEFSILAGLSAQIGYFLLATLLLTGPVLIISVLDRAFPHVTQKISLYAALIFSTSSWMLGRGFHPNKLNFFYALILLLGITAIILYRSARPSYSTRRRALLGVVVMPAIIFGHQFSAGAAMIFLLVIGGFAAVLQLIDLQRLSTNTSTGDVLVFVTAYFLGVIGNPIHQGPLLERLADVLLSVVQSAQTVAVTGAGGPGRYSQLGLNVLIASTAAQTLLFTLGILGAIWLFRQRQWEYDFVIVWMGSISLFLVVSLLSNSTDTAPQRFYGLLVLFGFNVCVGGFFYLIDNRSLFDGRIRSINVGRIAIVVLVVAFAITSLVSPVADKATSPVADDLPHFRQFDTNQRIQGDQWSDQYGSGVISMTDQNTVVPIQRISENRGRANLGSLDEGDVVTYSSLANRTGVISGSGLTLGGREFLFVESPVEPRHGRIYANGETVGFVVR